MPPSLISDSPLDVGDLREDALHRAEIQWRRHKAPMACYWKAVGVYAGHLARTLR